jgi:hypothetical protein
MVEDHLRRSRSVTVPGVTTLAGSRRFGLASTRWQVIGLGMSGSVRGIIAMPEVFGLQKSTTFESADLSTDYLVVDE